MNRRSFVRFLGLAPTAAILPLAGIAAAAKQTAEAEVPIIIQGSGIKAGSITAKYLRVTDANLGAIGAGTIRSADGRTRIDLNAGNIALED